MQLSDTVEMTFRLRQEQKTALLKLGIKTLRDLIFHFPTRYGDTSKITRIESLEPDTTATVFGVLKNLETKKGYVNKIPMARATLEDETGKISCVWFNQPYIAKMLADNSLVRVEGRVTEKTGKLSFSNPKIEKVDSPSMSVGNSLFGESAEDHHLFPVYPESRGITSNWFFHAIQKVISHKLAENIEDPIPNDLLEKYSLPKLSTALVWIHAPKKEDHARSARKRFSFEEIFMIQLEKQLQKKQYENLSTFVIKKNTKDLGPFFDRLGFMPTEAQHRAILAILHDFGSPHAMMRLLEGDVGSGKTAVAAAATWAVVNSRPQGKDFGNLQTAYMAPTEILATQHFESFIKYFIGTGISVGLMTGSGCRKFPSKVNPSSSTPISRAQLLKWVANGEIPVLIGTHSLIQKSVAFKHLAFAIIDEQHRFGTKQRQKLITKDKMAPHLLSMTATPIPRTLALTMYGDLDLTIIDEMPAGRKKIVTEVVDATSRKSMYEKIRHELNLGRQAYIICPRIDEPDPDKALSLQAKSVKAEAKYLKEKVFKEFEIGILHGKMTPAEKDISMKNFVEGKFDILCATSVVEVGVSVENATVILIEGAERFGLAQLHQLRGRVLRGNHQPYCFVAPEKTSTKTTARLKALTQAKNGFELAEHDLKQRGAGELAGTVQWGISDIAMEALQNLKMVEAARNEARTIVDKNPTLDKFPILKAIIENKQNAIHFE